MAWRGATLVADALWPRPTHSRQSSGHLTYAYTLLNWPPLPFLAAELDELEREEFFRLKKVQKNKQKKTALEEAKVGRAHEALTLQHEPSTAHPY
jgi:hypothetical protein